MEKTAGFVCFNTLYGVIIKDDLWFVYKMMNVQNSIKTEAIDSRAPKTSWLEGWPVVLISIGGLLIGGAAYRITYENLNKITEKKISLDRPLNSLSYKITDWVGKDVPVPINIQRVAGADDFINRLYINSKDKIWVNIYIAYTANPRTMLGHKPQICYPASGWVYDDARQIEIRTNTNGHIPCRMFKFHWPETGGEERIVLSYYVVNGQTTDDESVFSGIGWRTPNIDGNAARYAAQIQISSSDEKSVILAAQEMSDMLIDFFPVTNKSKVSAGTDKNLK